KAERSEGDYPPKISSDPRNPCSERKNRQKRYLLPVSSRSHPSRVPQSGSQGAYKRKSGSLPPCGSWERFPGGSQGHFSSPLGGNRRREPAKPQVRGPF